MHVIRRRTSLLRTLGSNMMYTYDSFRPKLQHINTYKLFSAVAILRPCELLGWIQLRCECYVIVPYASYITHNDVGAPGELSFRLQSTPCWFETACVGIPVNEPCFVPV
jgi:hypothetical protein